MRGFLSKQKQLLLRKFKSGDPRSNLAKRQIVLSFLLKGISIAIGLAYVPILIDYLDNERYGIWLTLSSLIGWFSFFNLGLGNGLRNKLVIAIAENNTALAKEYVSTTYAILSIIFISIAIAFLLLNPYLNWPKILNTRLVPEKELSILGAIVFSFFCFRFILDIVAVVARADQRPALANIFNPVTNLISISIIYVLIKLQARSSLIILGSLLSITPVLVLLLGSILLFSGKYNILKPSISAVNFSHTSSLMNLGIKFFILQIAAIVFFSSSNIIITQILGPSEVIPYNIAFKYFSIPTMVMGIIMAPIWSAVTDAYTKKDFNWLRRSKKKLSFISLSLILVTMAFIPASSFIYQFWIEDRVDVPIDLTSAMAVLTGMNLFLMPFSNFINGFGKLRLSIVIIIAKVILFIPLAVVLTKSSLGVTGTVLASILIQIADLVFQPIQVKKIINEKAIGIWNM